MKKKNLGLLGKMLLVFLSLTVGGLMITWGVVLLYGKLVTKEERQKRQEDVQQLEDSSPQSNADQEDDKDRLIADLRAQLTDYQCQAEQCQEWCENHFLGDLKEDESVIVNRAWLLAKEADNCMRSDFRVQRVVAGLVKLVKQKRSD